MPCLEGSCSLNSSASGREIRSVEALKRQSHGVVTEHSKAQADTRLGVVKASLLASLVRVLRRAVSEAMARFQEEDRWKKAEITRRREAPRNSV